MHRTKSEFSNVVNHIADKNINIHFIIVAIQY